MICTETYKKMLEKYWAREIFIGGREGPTPFDESQAEQKFTWGLRSTRALRDHSLCPYVVESGGESNYSILTARFSALHHVGNGKELICGHLFWDNLKSA